MGYLGKPLRETTSTMRRDSTVLILDDEQIVRSTLTGMLSRMGFHVIEAATAAEAIALGTGSGTNIELFIIDVASRGGSGTCVALEMRRHCPGVPILLTSGTPIEGWRDQDIEALGRFGPAADFLDKPFSLQRLEQKIKTLLSRRSSAPSGESDAANG